jgi:nitrate reductase NapE
MAQLSESDSEYAHIGLAVRATPLNHFKRQNSGLPQLKIDTSACRRVSRSLIKIKAAHESLDTMRPEATARMPSTSKIRGGEMSAAGQGIDKTARRRRMEVFAFLFLTAVVMPALAVATVGGYGLAVWIYQMMVGPPGPPAP